MKRGITNDGSTGNEASTKTKPSALTSSEAEGCLFLHNKDRSDETEAAGIIKLVITNYYMINIHRSCRHTEDVLYLLWIHNFYDEELYFCLMRMRMCKSNYQ